MRKRKNYAKPSRWLRMPNTAGHEEDQVAEEFRASHHSRNNLSSLPKLTRILMHLWMSRPLIALLRSRGRGKRSELCSVQRNQQTMQKLWLVHCSKRPLRTSALLRRSQPRRQDCHQSHSREVNTDSCL